ncbi:haloacid dehalogenase type II [Alphaproteobacteria bacterium LSUCC0719]
MKLSDFSVLTFDCYGTLIDWESGMIAGLRPLTDRVAAHGGRHLDRNMILEAHARQESTHQRQTPGKRYSDVLACVYRRLAEEWGMSVSWDEAMAYGRSVADWPAFADSADALAYLKQHFKLVILSNVDNASFAHSNNRLGVAFDAIYTAEDVGSYKPDDGNFTYMLAQLETLGIGKADILHTAESMFHDHAPANRHGLANCWIYRRHADKGFGATMNPGDMPSYDFQYTSMAAMVEAHKAELAGG